MFALSQSCRLSTGHCFLQASLHPGEVRHCFLTLRWQRVGQSQAAASPKPCLPKHGRGGIQHIFPYSVLKTHHASAAPLCLSFPFTLPTLSQVSSLRSLAAPARTKAKLVPHQGPGSPMRPPSRSCSELPPCWPLHGCFQPQGLCISCSRCQAPPPLFSDTKDLPGLATLRLLDLARSTPARHSWDLLPNKGKHESTRGRIESWSSERTPRNWRQSKAIFRQTKAKRSHLQLQEVEGPESRAAGRRKVATQVSQNEP